MGILSSILGINPEKILDSASGLARIFVGDKSQKESNVHSEQESAYDVLQAEAQAQQRDSRTWFDSLIDGVNRLPRPLGFFAVLGILIWCPIDPVSFADAMVAYQLVPEWLALIVGQVFLMFYGGRLLENWKSMKAVDPKLTTSVLAQLKATNPQQKEGVNHNNIGVSQSAVEPLNTARPISNEAYEKEMKDTSRPLSLPSILKWNEKNK